MSFNKAAYDREWRKSPHGLFTDQRQNARRRGVEWRLTLEEWTEIWGDKLPKRGRCAECFVMARNGDVGPYAVGNVRVITGRENRAETTGRKKAGWDRWRARRDQAQGHEMENAGRR